MSRGPGMTTSTQPQPRPLGANLKRIFDMNAIDTILRKLPKAKTAADFASASAALEAEKTKLAADVAALKAKREQTIFNGGKLEPVERDIVAAQDAARTLDVALDGASKRRTQAAEAEAEAKLVKVADEAGKLNKTLRARLIAFGIAAEVLTGHAVEIKQLRLDINVANNIVREGGRSDLVSHDPVRDLPAVVGRSVRDPVKALVVPEFFPHRHEDGPALLKMPKK